MQPPRRVDDQHVGGSGNSRVERVVGDGGRITPQLSPDEPRAAPLGPDGQLLRRGGPERIARGEDHLSPVVGVELGELAYRRRLADAVDPGDHNDERRPGLALDAVLLGRSQRRLDLESEELPYLGFRPAAPAEAPPEGLHQMEGRFDAQVGGYQSLLYRLERLAVDSGAPAQSRPDPLCYRASGLRQAITQPREPVPHCPPLPVRRRD